MQLTFLHLLDWILISVSFFNTIAMCWLGLTVLLNAERRGWGTWLAGGGLMISGLFFAAHSGVVGRTLGTFRDEMEIWWRVGWLAFVAAPYLWYLVMAWFAGVLSERRQRLWLVMVTLLGLAALLLLWFGHPLPSYGQVVSRLPGMLFTVFGMPVALLIYPVYTLLCIVLSLVALRTPASSERFMGDVGRQRARPWLFAASLVLLIGSLVVGLVAAWFLRQVQLGSLPFLSMFSLALIMGFDLLISGLIAIVVVLLGKAVVSYEVFTGKVLPRGGLARYWRRSLLLAAGLGVAIGGGLASPLDPVWQIVSMALFVTLFYALLTWRTLLEREREVIRLRPFVASQELYERLLGPQSRPEVLVRSPFYALCDDILNARLAYLVPLGSLASLAMPPLSFPQSKRAFDATEWLLHLPQPTDPATTLCLPLDPQQAKGAVWGVSLWSARGPAGWLLLGTKRDDGLYTQEEIELARTTCERLLDSQSAAELSRRLMALQRERLAESQILDRHTRRVLHDDVLPLLHAAMLRISSQPSDPRGDAAVDLLSDAHRRLAHLLRELPPTAEPGLARLGLIGALRQVIDGELQSAFDRVEWQLDPDAVQSLDRLPSVSSEVLFGAAREALRNAARYGRDPALNRPLYLTVALGWRHAGDRSRMLELRIEDNVVGIGRAQADPKSSGQGLVLHSTLMAVIGGMLEVEQLPSGGASMVLALPHETW